MKKSYHSTKLPEQAPSIARARALFVMGGRLTALLSVLLIIIISISTNGNNLLTRLCAKPPVQQQSMRRQTPIAQTVSSII
ncbi:hypothetical protein D3C81_1822070 [compost metagenome]